TLALKIAARDLAGGGGVLAVLAGQREEGQVLRLLAADGGDEHGCVAAAHHDGAGLLGELAGLDADLDLADGAGLGSDVHEESSAAGIKNLCIAPAPAVRRVFPRLISAADRRGR